MPDSYLPFVIQTIDTLWQRQAKPMGGDGPPMVTISRNALRAWTSYSKSSANTYDFLPVKEQPLELDPVVLDLGVWPILDKLSELTGDPTWRRQCDAMAEAFAGAGFDDRSGLIYAGAQASLDVTTGKPEGSLWRKEAEFKYGGALPWERLWAVAPAKMARFSTAVYYGLITRPEDMAFNRYVAYHRVDDRSKKHALAFSPRHVGFAFAAASMMQTWSTCAAKTGDREALDWTRRMALKWQQVQHPRTGLVPHFFGVHNAVDAEQLPCKAANVHELGAAMAWIETAKQLASIDGQGELAADVEGMGVRLLAGLARESYDPVRKVFPHWLKLDGGEDKDTAFYMFRSQAAKDEALAVDTRAEAVEVWPGDTFYDGPMRQYATGNRVPGELAVGAELTGDAELLEIAAALLEEAIEQEAHLVSEHNAKGQWTYPETASYIRGCVALHRATGKACWRDAAHRLAQRQLARLDALPEHQTPQWWRLPRRNSLLAALLELEANP